MVKIPQEVVQLVAQEPQLMVGHIELVNQVVMMETFEVPKTIRTMQDLTQAPTYVVKNYDIDEGTFEVWYNDGSLANDDWYGPMNLSLAVLKPEEEEPIRMQIARKVHSKVQQSALEECDMSATKMVLAQLMGEVQEVSVIDVIKHEEVMRKKDSPSTEPICENTQIMSIYNEDDFDEQFEALLSLIHISEPTRPY